MLSFQEPLVQLKIKPVLWRRISYIIVKKIWFLLPSLSLSLSLVIHSNLSLMIVIKFLYCMAVFSVIKVLVEHLIILIGV